MVVSFVKPLSDLKLLLMYPNVPGAAFWFGTRALRASARYCFATALNRPAGMMLPGNGSRMKPEPFGLGRVVAGS